MKNSAQSITEEYPSCDIFLARQPIYDAKMKVIAYDILHDDSSNHGSEIHHSQQSDSQVLMNSLIEVGLKELVDDSLAFLPIGQDFLEEKLPIPFELEHIVLQISQDNLETEYFISELTALNPGNKYPLALRNFLFDDSKKDLLAMADYVKLNVSQLSDNEIENQIQQLKSYDTLIIAEDVETQDDFNKCKQLGFDYFQGYFFCTPRIIKGHRTPSSRLAILNIMNEMQDPEITFETLEKLIEKDVALSYRILRYINSAYYALSKPVETLKQAIRMLGLRNIKTWVTIIAQSKFDDKPYELMITSLIRARMCESLAKEMGITHESVFIIGLFSALDALLDKPMQEVLESLPLTDEVNNALLLNKGPLGELLAYVIAYEQGNWQMVLQSDLDSQTWKNIYMDSIQWTRKVGDEMLALPPEGP